MSSPVTFAEINRGFFLHNLRETASWVGKKVKIMAIIKADAYGHGIKELARIAEQGGVYALGVSNLAEGLFLRKEGISLPILLLDGFLPEEIGEAIENNLSLAVSSSSQIRIISTQARKRRKKAGVHLKVDTGMGRLGFKTEELISGFVKWQDDPFITLEGIFSHLAAAYDPKEKEFTLIQISIFRKLIEKLRKKTERMPLIHLANSAAILNYPESYYDLVRPGIILYGYPPHPEFKPSLNFKTVMSCKTAVTHLQRIKKGGSVSYGRTYRVTRDSLMAVLPLGYAQGYSRLLSHKSEFLLRGRRIKQTGVICMDMCMADITPFSAVNPGEKVVILGGQGKEKITAWELAGKIGTIPYEVLCNLGSRMPRVYI